MPFRTMMNGVDAIAFTAGVGENSISTRRALLPILAEAYGIEYDPSEANKEVILDGKGFKISGPNSKIDIFVIPTTFCHFLYGLQQLLRNFCITSTSENKFSRLTLFFFHCLHIRVFVKFAACCSLDFFPSEIRM